MLSPTDLHYIVGFVARISGNPDVDVILGERIFDPIAKIKRDIDVTVIGRKPDGSQIIIKGVEVKRKRTPLDIVAVEQLCAKFEKLGPMDRSVIVSASGFSKAAINEAACRGVDLLELVPWSAVQAMGNVNIAANMAIEGIITKWEKPPAVEIFLDADLDVLPPDDKSVPVFDSEGKPIGGVATLEDLTDWIQRQAQLEAEGRVDKALLGHGGINMKIDVKLEKRPSVMLEGKLVTIPLAIVHGKLVAERISMGIEAKALRKVGEVTPSGGFAVGEGPNGDLVGIVVDDEARGISMIYIPLSTRTKQKVKQVMLF